jgi:hypothetical protein
MNADFQAYGGQSFLFQFKVRALHFELGGSEETRGTRHSKGRFPHHITEQALCIYNSHCVRERLVVAKQRGLVTSAL